MTDQELIDHMAKVNEQLLAENTVLVEALQQIKYYDTESMTSYPVHIIAKNALIDTSEQAKALTRFMNAARIMNDINKELCGSPNILTYGMPHFEAYPAVIELECAIAAYDKLMGGGFRCHKCDTIDHGADQHKCERK